MSGNLLNVSSDAPGSSCRACSPRAVESCRNCRTVSLADKRQAEAKDAMWSIGIEDQSSCVE